MEKVRRQRCEVTGFTARTNNDNEMQPERAKIGGLWQEFSRRLAEKGITPGVVYGIYSNFESDECGDYDITVAMADDPTLSFPDRLTIPAGGYLRFVKAGPQPLATIELWREIWRYFADSGAPKRTFCCDFEEYVEPGEVAIYIGIEEER
jgi:predicted transcriptional regulator YdeE